MRDLFFGILVRPSLAFGFQYGPHGLIAPIVEPLHVNSIVPVKNMPPLVLTPTLPSVDDEQVIFSAADLSSRAVDYNLCTFSLNLPVLCLVNCACLIMGTILITIRGIR